MTFADRDVPLPGTFVGRTRELAALRAALDDACRGRGRMVLVTGDAGIGKTRLCDELTRHAEARGARVLWARCWEGEGAPAYWPWKHALRAYLRDCEPGRLAAQLGAGAADVAQIIPEAVARLPGVASAVGRNAEDLRFRVFDSTAEFLRSAAADQPLVVVLDDLQAADESSLLLLQFVARSLRAMHLMIIGTQREPPAGDAAPLLGDLARESDVIRLGGLSAAEIETLIDSVRAAMPVAAPARSLAAAIHAVTEGNPFFVDAVLRLLIAGDRFASGELPASGTFRIPQEIRAAIHRRLQSLSADARDLLGAACVMGREFDLRVVETLRPCRSLHPLLREAETAGVVTAGPSPWLYGFSHVLIRDALYDELPRAPRAVLHRDVAQCLERIHGDDPDHFSQIASHFLRAAIGTDASAPRCRDVERAVAYAAQAGDRAAAMLAYEEAASCYERALQALDLGEPQPRRRCELSLARGDAYRKAGDSARSRAVFVEAAGMARRLHAADEPQAGELLARAALGLGTKGFWGPTAAGEVDDVLVALLEESLAVLGPQDSALRAQLLACLAVSVYWSPEKWRSGAHLGAQAVAIARRVGDPVTRLICLASRHIIGWTPDNIDERIAAAGEMLRLAEQLGHRELNLFAYAVHLADVMEIGDIEAVRTDVAAYTRLAHELRQPHYLWWLAGFRTTVALLAARLDDAERLAGEALAMGQEARPTDAPQVFGVHQFTLRRERGGLEELAVATEALSEQHPAIPAWRCGLALLLAELGRSLDAQRLLDSLAADEFAAVRRDMSWIVSMSLLAETAALLRDLPCARTLYQLIRPYAERVVVVGYGYACWGSLSRHLGLLAATLSRWEDAAQHFQRALEVNTRLGARLCLARTQVDYAEMLLRRAQPGDQAQADTLIASALQSARECGMHRLAERAQRLQRGDANTPAEPPAAEARGIFKLHGDYWTVAGAGSVLRLKDTKGLRYIHHLLAHPDREFHVINLVRLVDVRRNQRVSGGGDPDSTTLSGDHLFTDAGVLVDAQARAAYEQRRRDLAEEIEEASQLHDLGRAEKARAELDCITEQLAAGFGIGGRPRRVGSPAEQARINVTKLINGAIRKIRENDAALARYLATSIRTGTYCAYTPDPQRSMRWEV
jgi:tetratricopeptide (TPR) repeat protein